MILGNLILKVPPEETNYGSSCYYYWNLQMVWRTGIIRGIKYLVLEIRTDSI